MSVPVSTTPFEECKEGVCEFYATEGGHKHEDMPNITMMPPFIMDVELSNMLDSARAYWKELAEAGTPYWCVHKGREVDHPAAYWKNDGYFRMDGLEIQYKHGVMCGECGGYIQEG